MKILGIETSCDETAAAVIEDGKKILSSVVTSSIDIHQESGGIIPEIAAREQIRYFLPVIQEALSQSAISDNNKKKGGVSSQSFMEIINGIDALAVTVGPGLIGSLLIGVETAKTIAFTTKKPIIPINHVLAHPYANWLTRKEEPLFPAITLVVSGGHTELFFVENHQNWKWLGGTRDDAAGEAFDKIARLMELSYPGGPAIANEAAKLSPSQIYPLIKLPRPMIEEETFDFSFSGLKTAVIREIHKLKSERNWCESVKIKLASEVQESITDVLVKKTLKAARSYQVRSIILGGGVAANQRLKEKLSSFLSETKSSVKLFIPPPNLCTDNAAYIASYAYFHYQPVPWSQIQAKPDLEVEVS